MILEYLLLVAKHGDSGRLALVHAGHGGRVIHGLHRRSALRRPLVLDRGGLVLVLSVLGGSQGATILGTLVPDALEMIDTPLRDNIRIYQQARPEQIDNLKARYRALGITASIKPFFTNMPDLLAKSDLVISRSGASSIAELAATGRASLMLPLPSAMDEHQKANALQME